MMIRLSKVGEENSFTVTFGDLYLRFRAGTAWSSATATIFVSFLVTFDDLPAWNSLGECGTFGTPAEKTPSENLHNDSAFHFGGWT